MRTNLSSTSSHAEDNTRLLDLVARWLYQVQVLKLWAEQFNTGTLFITKTMMKRLLKNTAVLKDPSGQFHDKHIRRNEASIAQNMLVLWVYMVKTLVTNSIQNRHHLKLHKMNSILGLLKQHATFQATPALFLKQTWMRKQWSKASRKLLAIQLSSKI